MNFVVHKLKPDRGVKGFYFQHGQHVVEGHTECSVAMPATGILDGRAVVNPHANLAAFKPEHHLFLFLPLPHTLEGVNGVE